MLKNYKILLLIILIFAIIFLLYTENEYATNVSKKKPKKKLKKKTKKKPKKKLKKKLKNKPKKKSKKKSEQIRYIEIIKENPVSNSTISQIELNDEYCNSIFSNKECSRYDINKLNKCTDYYKNIGNCLMREMSIINNMECSEFKNKANTTHQYYKNFSLPNKCINDFNNIVNNNSTMTCEEINNELRNNSFDGWIKDNIHNINNCIGLTKTLNTNANNDNLQKDLSSSSDQNIYTSTIQLDTNELPTVTMSESRAS